MDSNVYLNALTQFKAALLNSIGPSSELAIDIVPGRKFDRVRIRHIGTTNLARMLNGDSITRIVQDSVRFFIDRSNGNIYGRRSHIAPNLKWYFGDIFSAQDWTWTMNGAVPKDMTKYRVISKYGDHAHYERIPTE